MCQNVYVLLWKISFKKVVSKFATIKNYQKSQRKQK